MRGVAVPWCGVVQVLVGLLVQIFSVDDGQRVKGADLSRLPLCSSNGRYGGVFNFSNDGVY